MNKVLQSKKQNNLLSFNFVLTFSPVTGIKKYLFFQILQCNQKSINIFKLYIFSYTYLNKIYLFPFVLNLYFVINFNVVAVK